MEEKKLTLYSKNNCPACVKAEALLKLYNIPYDVKKIDCDEQAKAMILARGHRTVPQLYVGDKLFVEAGYMGLIKMSEEEIKRLLYGVKT